MLLKPHPISCVACRLTSFVGFRLVIECLVIFFFFVETKGPTLEEIAVLFDGENSAAGTARTQAQEKVMPADERHEYIGQTPSKQE